MPNTLQVLNAARKAKLLQLDEQAVGVREDMRGACELLGFDPPYLANEGRFVAFVTPQDAERALEMEAIDHYLKLDRKRREIAHSHGADAPPFQPLVNYRTRTFDKALSTRGTGQCIVDDKLSGHPGHFSDLPMNGEFQTD